MAEELKTGIIFCQDILAHSESPDIKEIESFSKKLKPISAVWTNGSFSKGNIDQTCQELIDKELKRVVIVGRSPWIWKNHFSRAMVKAGLDPGNITLAKLKQNGESSKEVTEKLKAIIRRAVKTAKDENSYKDNASPINQDTMVIGGGIAGIQASLEIADADLKVHLVERSGTIGGHMAMFDKTFPTLDCAACILTPKMGEIGQHDNIHLHSYSEVQKIEGEYGNYQVSILKKARRVDEDLCKGCGDCATVCPRKVKSEFDAGTSLRKAIYIPFPQAVPNKYLIDAENCTYVEKGKCGVCVKKCPVDGCINLDAKDQLIEISVGQIIVATGFKTFDASRVSQFGYGQFPNVLTSLEFERLINASGPTEGEITFRMQDKKGNWIFNKGNGEPRSVGIIHCVGSRDENYNKYCSKVCCMYSLKLAHLVKEKLPEARVFEYYIDMRSYGKGYEEFYNRIKDEGINLIRGRTAKIEQKNDQLLLRSEDLLEQRILEQELDMVILSVGLEPQEDASDLAKVLKVHSDRYGWFKDLNPEEEQQSLRALGISFAGLCKGPADIPDTVAQGSAAAAKVLQNILRDKNKNETTTTTETKVDFPVETGFT